MLNILRQISLVKTALIRLLVLALGVQLFSACSSVPDSVLATMAGDTIRVPAYEEMFLRTRMTAPVDLGEKQQFLNTFTDYRLKLLEASAQGLDRDEAFQQEVQQYRDQLALTFLYDNELVEPGVRTLYDRRLEEVKLQHLVVKWVKFADDSIDTLTTRRKAEDMFEMVKTSPLPFDTLIMRFSDDASKERTTGELGWFIAGSSFPQLDDMMYSIEPGEYAPQLLRTVFGYHIFKLLDRKPARQRLRPAHILYRLDLNNPNDTTAGYAHLSLVLDSLKRGLATFEELALHNSQDSTSAASGGDLGWMTRGINLEPRFETALFNLEVGEVSNIIRTAFGMHIIKVLDEEPPLPYEQQRDDLRRIYRNERFAMDYLNFVYDKREEYQLRINDNVANQIMAAVDTTITTSTPGWHKTLPQEVLDAYLLRTTLGPVSVRDVVEAIRTEPTAQMRRLTRINIDTLALLVADEAIALDQTAGYEQKYPMFARLLKEYRESTLISNLEQKEIWDKVEASDTELKPYWEQHKEKYRFPPRVKFAEIFTYNEKQARQYLDSIANGADFQYIAARYTQRPGLYSTEGAWEYLPVDENELAKKAAKMRVGEISMPISFQGGFSVIKVLDQQLSRTKTFEEARSELIAAYNQDRGNARREAWMQALRTKHALVSYPEHLEHTFVPVKDGGEEK
ncbi:MAG: hypothetical protein C0600_03440 [Ignavibacteria bacterium]|nr:MAG: hypothetical protein C0600_03440 [Ignavibacteria bacterium]